MPNIKAILFDIDGTLLDTAEFMYHALEAALTDSHLPLPSREEMRTQFASGKSLEELLTFFYPKADLTKLVPAYRNDQMQHMELSIPFPNTISTLQKLKSAGIKIAAISSRGQMTLMKSLEVSGIISYFDQIISADQVKHLKPHPEGLRIALENFQITPSEAVMVGDTDGDVLAGKAAGTKTIGVTTGFRGEKIIGDHPDLVAHDISEVLEFISSQE